MLNGPGYAVINDFSIQVGTAKTFTIARGTVVTAECSACLAVVQRGRIGRVLGLSDITVS